MAKKRLSIIILIIITFLVLLFLIIFYSKKVANEKVNISSKQAATSQLKKDSLNYNLAQSSVNLDLCKIINNNELKNSCIAEIASSTNSSSTCLIINEPTFRTGCASQVLINEAVNKKSLAECEKFIPVDAAKDCINKIAENNNIDCGVIKNDELRYGCFSITYYNQAKIKNDASICNQIPSLAIRANCLSEIEKIDLHSDADKDGLDFLQEIINGTDPNKADTDGDGYSDGSEIKNGFNPNGDGLNKFASIGNCGEISNLNLKQACASELKEGFIDYYRCYQIKNPELLTYCEQKLKEIKK